MRVPSGENSRSEMGRRLSSVSAEGGVGEGGGDGGGGWENAGALIREKRTATRLSGRNMKHPPWKEQGTVTAERNMVNALAKRTRSKRQEQNRRRGERWRTCRDGKMERIDAISGASDRDRGRGRDPSGGRVRSGHAGHPSSRRRSGHFHGAAQSSARQHRAVGSNILYAKRSVR